MNNPVRSLFAIGAFAFGALFAQAQTSQIVVVDMAKLFDSHYKTQEQTAKLQADEQKAQQDLEKMNGEGNALVEQLKDLQEQGNNPTATAEAKQKAGEAAQAKYGEIRKKQEEVNQFRENITRNLQQRFNNFKGIMLDEISKLATEIATKKHSATLLLDKSGPSMIGIPSVVYASPTLDITDEVLAEINKTRPAAPAAVAAPAAAPAPAAATPAASPTITVPGSKK